jgi:RNA polymerase subunit RPABC4/transcription elongation factor Spt4
MCGGNFMHLLDGLLADKGQDTFSERSQAASPKAQTPVVVTTACPSCRAFVPARYTWCPECGAALKPRACTYCGQLLGAQGGACPHCGAPPVVTLNQR